MLSWRSSLARPYREDDDHDVQPGDVDLDALADADLAFRAQRGDGRATDVLLPRYRPTARAKARSYFLVGSERDDVVQEATIGLFKAIRDYNAAGPGRFRAFAELCISRQIFAAIQRANRQKHQALNRSISLEASAADDDEEPVCFLDPLVTSNASLDPVELVIWFQEIEALRFSMCESLTPLERDALVLHMDGKSYEEIADALGSNVKSIDNALQRVKRKIQRHLDERDALAGSSAL